MVPVAFLLLISFAHGHSLRGADAAVRDESGDSQLKNVVVVPPNCKDGQELINGECRDVWLRNAQNQNTIVAPPNCKDGQELINGECRDVWLREYNVRNVVVVPPNCKDGQQLINGVCRDVWLRILASLLSEKPPSDLSQLDILIKNIITIPTQCPEGYKLDANGICRQIL